MESRFIADLMETIDIPADGTLSRVLYKDERIRLVGFAFDKDQELTEHSSASTAIVQVVSGSIMFEVDGHIHEMTRESWLVVPPRRPHALRATQPAKVLLTLLKDATDSEQA